MRINGRHLLLVLGVSLLHTSEPPRAAEICGDGVDNDSNSLTDEGCQSPRVTSTHESPLPSTVTGMISPKSGQLVYPEAPDIQGTVPFGPPLVFQRTFLSQYEPYASGYSAPVDYKAPLGEGWHHNFMSWVSDGASDLVVHLTTGQDVRFTYASNDGTYNYYTPQAGHHVDYLRERIASPSIWEMRTLDGWVYSYEEQDHTIWKLTSIADGPGQELVVSYYQSGSPFGQIEKVVDASGRMELRFSYGTDTGPPYTARSLIKVEYWNAGTNRAEVTFENSLTPTWAKLGGVQYRTYGHDGNGKLTTIQDANSPVTTMASFVYHSTDVGKVVRVHTGGGSLGYSFADSGCNSGSGTYIFFNRHNDTSCTSDAGCASGEYCGGKVGTTGQCFKARRCAAWVSGNEDMIGAVTSTACSTCVDTADRSWDTTNVELDGEKSADNVWTSYLYNADSLVKQIVEGDSDADATTVPAGARVTYFKYGDADFPGLVTETRRLSEFKPGGTCHLTATTDCKRTLYVYTAGGQLDQQRELGFTLDSTGAVVSYDFTTNYTLDAKGRLTKVSGPRTDTTYDVVDYEYYSDTDSDQLQAGRLKYLKRKLNGSTFITTSFGEYDKWGLAGFILDPNGTATCETRASRGASGGGALTERRIAMNGQTSCATSHSSDIVTSFTYDAAFRTTQVMRSVGDCTHYEYNLSGQISKIKARDNCDKDSGGDTQEFTYGDDGLRTKIEYKDAAGNVTYRREVTYGADRRLAEILNPSDTSKKQTFTYEADGMIDTVVGEDGVGKTEWAYDNLNRVDLEKRYTASAASDDWNLTPGVQLDLPFEVEDEDAKSIEWTWDDLGRKVKQITPDGGTHIMVYDPAGNLVTHVEASGSADARTHTFTYDPQNRVTAENYGDAACFTLGGAEVQYTYDLPSGCPTGTCVNSNGRLAFVKTKISCDDARSDDTFDQLTYFGYDDAGRIVKETIQDDGGRDVSQSYAWDENGNVTQVTAPSGYYQKSIFGSAGHNSDASKLVRFDRGTGGTDTTYADNGVWLPFGPLKEYRQANTISSNQIMARLSWDLAHRPTSILYEQATSGTDLFQISHTLDSKGRVTARDYTGGQSSLQDSYFTYDWLDRITCDAATSSACPPTNANLKSHIDSSPPYTASSDRRSMSHRQSTIYPVDTFTTTYVSGTDKVYYVTKSNGNKVWMGWDTRGNRLYDDDDQWESPEDDRRDYTYDARNNLITVAGKTEVSGALHNYVETNAYDHKNRRFFKSVLDTTPNPDVESQTFYYYDLGDRLIEVKYTPDISASSTYQLFQFYWIGSRPVALVQTTYPAGTVARRFLHSDELAVPIEGYTWPTSGDATRFWAWNPDAFGWGRVIAGPTNYQPLRFPGQVWDEETTSWNYDSGTSSYVRARPPLHDNRYRVYDPFTGTYLQVDPDIGNGWNSYDYAASNPVMNDDPMGLWVDEGFDEDPSVSQYVDWLLPDWGAPDFWECRYPGTLIGPCAGDGYWSGGDGGGGGGGGGKLPPSDGCDPDVVTTTETGWINYVELYKMCGITSPGGIYVHVVVNQGSLLSFLATCACEHVNGPYTGSTKLCGARLSGLNDESFDGKMTDETGEIPIEPRSVWVPYGSAKYTCYEGWNR